MLNCHWKLLLVECEDAQNKVAAGGGERPMSRFGCRQRRLPDLVCLQTRQRFRSTYTSLFALAPPIRTPCQSSLADAKPEFVVRKALSLLNRLTKPIGGIATAVTHRCRSPQIRGCHHRCRRAAVRHKRHGRRCIRHSPFASFGSRRTAESRKQYRFWY